MTAQDYIDTVTQDGGLRLPNEARNRRHHLATATREQCPPLKEEMEVETLSSVLLCSATGFLSSSRRCCGLASHDQTCSAYCQAKLTVKGRDSTITMSDWGSVHER